MRKVISYLVAVMMVLTMMPYTAFAGSTANEMTTPAYTWVNPAYEDVIDESDLNTGGEPVSPFSAEITYATTPAEAAECVKEYVLNRVETFMFYYKFPMAEAEGEWFGELMDEIFGSVFDHTGNPDEGDYIYYSYGGYDIPSTPISGDGTYWYLEVPVTVTYYTTYEQEEELNEAIDELLDEIIVDGMTDYEKVEAIYDYMTSNIVYDHDNLEDSTYKLKYTAYAALINGTSVCQGYANLFYRLALECGIDARIISGQANGGPHAWNIVKLDGKYYLVDATWDASYVQAGWDYMYFLKPSFDDHDTADKFLTDEFKAAYPMADNEYVPEAGEGEDPEPPVDPDDPVDPDEPEKCKHTQTEIIPAVPASCTATGLAEGLKCASCGEVLTAQEEVPATGHTYGNWVVEAKATTSVNGKKAEKCWCGETLNTVVINKASEVRLAESSYIYNGMAISPEFIVKDSEGQTINESNYEITGPETEPKEVGTYTYKLNFRGDYSGTINLVLKINLPKTDIVNVVAESNSITITWNPLDGLVDGYQIYTAKGEAPFTLNRTVSDSGLSSVKINGLYSGTLYKIKIRSYKTVDAKKFYSEYSDVISAETLKSSSCTEHEWDNGTITVKPGCETEGELTYKCLNEICDDTFTEKIPALGHKLTKHVAKDPTCTVEGNIEYYTCSECSKLFADAEGKKEIKKPDTVIVDSEAHIFTEVTVAPTCTEPGQKKLVCIGCGKTIVMSTIPANGHDFGEWKEIENPTCIEDGVIERVCKTCGYTERVGLPALKHEPEIMEAKQATLKAAGMTEGEKCGNCGTVLKAQESIPRIKAPVFKNIKFVYDGKVKKPTITIKDFAGNKLGINKNYTVIFKNQQGKVVAKPLAVGQYTAIVTFKGDYSGTVSKQFTINPKATQFNKLTKPAKKQIKVTWQKRTAQVTGYEIQYSTTKNFTKKTTQTVKVKNFKINVKTIKNLKLKKKYWVKIRTYKTVGKKTYYSTWSKVRTITTK